VSHFNNGCCIGAPILPDGPGKEGARPGISGEEFTFQHQAGVTVEQDSQQGVFTRGQAHPRAQLDCETQIGLPDAGRGQWLPYTHQTCQAEPAAQQQA
jgi:hypothetical protein